MKKKKGKGEQMIRFWNNMHIFWSLVAVLFLRYIGAHIHPFKPVDLTSTPKKSPAAKKRKAKKGAASGEKKKRKTGSQPPYRLSPELQAVVGTDILPRPQVVSKIWVYIKANNLQNEKDKREILCDDKLQTVFKRKKISMFKMNAEIGRHLLEKLDKSEYQHEEEEDVDDIAGAASDDDDSDSDWWLSSYIRLFANVPSVL